MIFNQLRWTVIFSRFYVFSLQKLNLYNLFYLYRLIFFSSFFSFSSIKLFLSVMRRVFPRCIKTRQRFIKYYCSDREINNRSAGSLLVELSSRTPWILVIHSPRHFSNLRNPFCYVHSPCQEERPS